MSDIFTQFSDFIDKQGHRRWPKVGLYQAGDRFCVSTYIGVVQYGDVWQSNAKSDTDKASLMARLESDFRHNIETKVLTEAA